MVFGLISQRSRAVDVANTHSSLGIEDGFNVTYDYNPRKYSDIYQLGENISSKEFNEQDAENMAQMAGATTKANVVRSEYLKQLGVVIKNTVQSHSGDNKFAQQQMQNSQRLHESKNQLFEASLDNAFQTTVVNNTTQGFMDGYKNRYRNVI